MCNAEDEVDDLNETIAELERKLDGQQGGTYANLCTLILDVDRGLATWDDLLRLAHEHRAATFGLGVVPA